MTQSAARRCTSVSGSSAQKCREPFWPLGCPNDMWLLLATAITVAAPDGATLDSSQVLYTVNTATLTITLSSKDAAAHLATVMIDVPRDARATAMSVTIGGVRSEAKRESSYEAAAEFNLLVAGKFDPALLEQVRTTST